MVKMISPAATKGIALLLCLSLLFLIGQVLPSSRAFAAHASSAYAAHASDTAHHSTQVRPFINTAPCNGRTDLFQVYADGLPGGEICYANAGRVSVFIPGLNFIKSGANHGHITVEGFGNIHFTYYQNLPFSHDVLTYICMGPGC